MASNFEPEDEKLDLATPRKGKDGTPLKGIAAIQLSSPLATESEDSVSVRTRPRTGSLLVDAVPELMSERKAARPDEDVDLTPEAFELSSNSDTEVAPRPRPLPPYRPRKPVEVKPLTAYYATAKQRDKLAAWRQEWRNRLGWGRPNARYFQPRNHILI